MYFSNVFVRALSVTTLAIFSVTTSAPADITYSATADFGEGMFINLNPNGNQLQVNTWNETKTAAPPLLPYIWIACSDRGTVVRMATADHWSVLDQKPVQAGDILGEYRTAPEGCGIGPGFGQDPSRTTVDFDGNVWVANRAYIQDSEPGHPSCGQEWCGHVVKIGSGLSFQWVDRNCNGVVDTSTGLGDIRAWPNPA
ncbi:MAG: hypothetical protein KJ749_09590 [Planctomycetes bacterium]|nr:hypothetical protein [Planctomycetota bacterium]